MKVLIVAGGTGGHIFPAIALADELNEKGADILFVGTKRNIETQIVKKNYSLRIISATAISRESLVRFIKSISAIWKSFFQSLRIINEFRPNVAIGFGGYASGPIILAARLKKIPTIIHEQNVYPGKTNSILSKFVNKIAISFQASGKYFANEKTLLTGCPVRQEILGVSREESLKLLNLFNDKFTILVMGGSLGSHKINQVFLEAVYVLEEKDKLQIIHICGDKDYEFVNSEYKKIALSSRIFPFLENMGAAYCLADLAICRSGAATISELAALGIASILIPYPIKRVHQRENALALSDKKAGILIDEQDLSPDILRRQISCLMNNREGLFNMSRNARKIGRLDAAENLAREVFSLAGG